MLEALAGLGSLRDATAAGLPVAEPVRAPETAFDVALLVVEEPLFGAALAVVDEPVFGAVLTVVDEPVFGAALAVVDEPVFGAVLTVVDPVVLLVPGGRLDWRGPGFSLSPEMSAALLEAATTALANASAPGVAVDCVDGRAPGPDGDWDCPPNPGIGRAETLDGNSEPAPSARTGLELDATLAGGALGRPTDGSGRPDPALDCDGAAAVLLLASLGAPSSSPHASSISSVRPSGARLSGLSDAKPAGGWLGLLSSFGWLPILGAPAPESGSGQLRSSSAHACFS